MNMVKIPTQEAVKIEDGVHFGTIVEVDQRDKPFVYVDFVVVLGDVTDREIKLKFGCPASISVDADGKPSTKLAKVLNKLGILAGKGEENDLDKAKGLVVQFQTVTEETENGNFARIVLESVKLKQ